MLHNIEPFMHKPALFAPSTAKFWDDSHISKGMLEAHINPLADGATRPHAFVRRSVQWIAQIAPPARHPRLLDLGCGPGIYAELLDDAGYEVAGIDLSQRSIAHAKASAHRKRKEIDYRVGDYLALDCRERFDLITLIYCDFGVLSTQNRAIVLQKAHAALRPGGMLVFDVFTPFKYAGQRESRTWAYEPQGFWSDAPYLCLNSLYRYDEENTILRQHLVVTQTGVNCYNIWDHTFTQPELAGDLAAAGFKITALYGNVAGDPLAQDAKQLCVVAKKPQ